MPEPDKRPSIGIDLGTTRSVVAYLDEFGRPQTVANSEGDLTTPSVVLFDEDAVLVGKEALKAVLVTPERVVRCIKRETGRKDFAFSIDGKEMSAELIQSFILGKVRHDAERLLGCEVTRAVVTVPAFYNDLKRHATIDACQLAGLKVTAAINEPTAAAIAFGAQHGLLDDKAAFTNPETMLVYDLGGGTFDVSLLWISNGEVNVMGVDGNARLGGVDWDDCLANWLADEFQRQFGQSPQHDALAMSVLRHEAEELKHTLTAKQRATARVAVMGQVMKVQVTRAEFDDMTAHLLDRTRFTAAKLLDDLSVSRVELDRILLVGGSTRMPQVAQMLEDTFDTRVDRSASPDQAVAHGAAIYAGLVAKRPADAEHQTQVKVSDVSSHHLGVMGVKMSTGDPCVQVMIPKNTPLPAQHAARFQTVRDGQRSVMIQLTEGGDEQGRHATRIGTFVVRDLPKDLPRGAAIDVILKYSRDGMLRAQATIVPTGKKTRLSLDRSAGLSRDQLDELREESADFFNSLGVDL